jgi:phytoene synthase
LHLTHPGELIREVSRLDRAYRTCATITSDYSRSFYLATALLPHEKRRAVRALYAFCRIADNIVDGGSHQAEVDLASWKKKALSNHPDGIDPVAFAWTHTRLKHRIPVRYAEQLIEGLEKDIQPVSYRTFNELSVYCYGAASTVGLMSMHIIGFTPEAIPYAIKLGVALQLTNILRDIGEDYRSGRLYLPEEELEDFGISKDDLKDGRVTDAWRLFMRFQIDRNRSLYEEAWPGISMLNADGRFAVAAASQLYQGILDDIEAHDYDTFSRRAHLDKWGKLQTLAKTFRRLKGS